MKASVILMFTLLLILCETEAARNKSAKSKSRSGRQSGRTTVISCRVFRRGVCKKTKSNIIVVNKSISNNQKCQQFCYATPGCAAFTHFDQSKTENRKCVLFRDCNGKLSNCNSCISGPIMPRITECLAARQEVAPEPEESGKPCSFGCTGLCLGPRCPELVSSLNNQTSANFDEDTRDNDAGVDDDELSIDTDETIDSKILDPNEQGDDSEVEENNDYENEVYDYDEVDDSVVDYDYQGDDIYDFNEEGSGASAGSDDSLTEYVDTATETVDDYEDYANVDVPVDLPLDENAIDEPEEEVEEVDVNIDEGFLEDSSGNPVNIPSVDTEDVEPRLGSSSTPSVNTNTGGNTFIFFFCALGGHNSNGPINLVDMIQTGLGNAAQSLTVAPVPASVMRGGEVSSAYTDGRITTCGNGWTILSPYGYIYKPGECASFNIQNNDWSNSGASLTSFRKGATITKLGRYLLATGGVKEKKPLKTIEAFDPKRPEKGWKRLEKLEMPAAVSEHCTVTVDGRKGKEVVITGGRKRETRALRLDVKSQRWYSMNRMTTGRRKHACIKAKINGRPGIVVSGGSGRGNKNMTSVEFFDSRSGEWLSMPSLNRGRRSHVMTVTKGKLLVAGGEGVGRSGKEYLDDMEIFNGQRWVTTNQKLDRPRSNFSLVKVPQRKGRSLQKKKMRRNRSKTKNRSRNPKRSF